MIKAVILDFDGVIRDIDVRSAEETTLKYGMKLEEFFSKIFGNELVKKLGRGEISRDNWWGELQKIYPELIPLEADFLGKQILAHSIINEEVLGIVRKLPDGVRTAIFSNTSLEAKELILEQISGYSFDHVIVSAELGHMKPEPEAYLKVLDILELDAQECIFFDDKQQNVDGAKDIGFHAYRFRNAEEFRKSLLLHLEGNNE